MSYGYVEMPPATPENSRKTSIVGVGETDYFRDYRAAREKKAGWKPLSRDELIKLAFERALSDAGLEAKDIDGLAVSATFDPPDPDELSGYLGLSPRRAWKNGHIMAGPLPAVSGEIIAGNHDLVAMVFCVTPRTAGRVFGGSSTHEPGQAGPSSYFYYHPWGWSSQAAHWALIASHYQSVYGVTEEDIGAVPIQIREHACMNPNAIMQQPLTMEKYLSTRYIVAPLRLFDICLHNDGAVCLIVSRADLARDLPNTPVDIAGWGETFVTREKMDMMVRQRLRPVLQDAAAQAFSMSGLTLEDVDHFEGYDAGSMHLINQVEGFGFAEPGTGFAFCRDGQMTLGGRIPTNTSGGNMSESYMQGWSQVVEVVRQLRHQAGQRQVEGAEVSLSALTESDSTHPILFQRGA